MEICLSRKISFSVTTQKRWFSDLGSSFTGHITYAVFPPLYKLCASTPMSWSEGCAPAQHMHGWGCNYWNSLSELPNGRARGRILCGSKTWPRFIMALVWFMLGESLCRPVCPYQICFYNKAPLRFYSLKELQLFGSSLSPAMIMLWLLPRVKKLRDYCYVNTI